MARHPPIALLAPLDDQLRFRPLFSAFYTVATGCGASGMILALVSPMMKILLIDDVQEYLGALSRALRAHDIVQAADLREARERMDESIELVLTDIRLSEEDAANRDGIQFLQWVKERYPRVPVVVMSAYRDHGAVVDALNLGAARYLKKPIQLRELNDLIAELSGART